MKIKRPDKYIQEISNDIQSIEAAKTNTAAFIGVSEKGPQDHALPINSFTEFQINFGGFLKGSWLAYSVFQFFENGGTNLYIARVSCHERRTPDESAYQKAFSLLDPIPEINLIAVPGIGSPSMVSFGSVYCEKRGDCIFLGDMSANHYSIKEVQNFFNGIVIKSSFGAVYFPWIKIKDPAGFSRIPIAIPPSGSVAGIFARTDTARGVWKAPAGLESNINGAIGLIANISNHDQNSLNLIGVNTIRDFPGKGVLIWGARTLAVQSNPEYKYIPVRRTSIFIEQSITKGTQWTVFEPNDEPLWERIRIVIGHFMMNLFKDGALQGSKPEDAYFVKCGRDTTSQNDINQGIINILVGFALLKPAEFSLIRITKRTAG
jgi:phage tail sheath protein FI